VLPAQHRHGKITILAILYKGDAMRSTAATQVKNHFGQILEITRTEPVTVEKQGRPVAVILSFEEYQRLAELEDRIWGERAAKALENGFMAEDEMKNWLEGKLNAEASDQ
jgi:antitoxin Phd